MVSIVNETRLYRFLGQQRALDKIRIRFGPGGAFQLNRLVFNFESANDIVKKADRTEFSLHIANNHIDPWRVALVVCVNIQLEQIVLLFFGIEKIQNGENAGAKEFGEKIEQCIELVLEQFATEPGTQTFTNGLQMIEVANGFV
jgi:hypothetical protein